MLRKIKDVLQRIGNEDDEIKNSINDYDKFMNDNPEYATNQQPDLNNEEEENDPELIDVEKSQEEIDKINSGTIKLLISYPIIFIDAYEARTQFYDIESKKSEYDEKITKLQKALEPIYGQDDEYLVLRDKCFELMVQQYNYKLCIFDSIEQKTDTETVHLG